jgi:hypothetical protein
MIDVQPGPGAVLFCQVPRSTGRSLLLHGSAMHLQDRSLLAGFPASVTIPFSAPTAFPLIVQMVIASRGNPMWRLWQRFGRQDPSAAEENLQANLTDLYSQVVGTDWFRASAPYLAGFAYVSGLVQRPDGSEIVVGSPLLVRRARPA